MLRQLASPIENSAKVLDSNTGFWQEQKSAPDDFLYCGAQAKALKPWNSGVDDLAMNGLILYACKISDWDLQVPITLIEGSQGDWYEKVMCPE